MGKLIVIDGLDGCGKHTQSTILANKLTEMGYKVKLFSFPNYDSLSAGPVKMYLSGMISKNPEDVNAYMASTLYAVDRAITFHSEIKEYYDKDYIIICDRYISSNIIYQSQKLEANELYDFIKWDYDLEVDKCKIPKEDLVICLTLPIETSQKLLEQRYNQLGGTKDIHENDLKFLEKCRTNLNIVCDNAVKLGYNYHTLDCSDTDKNILDANKISEMIIDIVNLS